MADQLTALQIKIEADIKDAIGQLNALSTTIQSVEKQVGTSVGNINRLLKSIDSKVVNIGVKVQGADQLQNFSKKAASAVGSNPLGVGIDTNGIDAFVARVKAGVQTSIEELKKFRKETAQLYEAKRLRLGVDDTEVVELRKKLEFINGFIQSAQRQVKVRISSTGDQELRNKLNGLQKEYVLQIIPSFNDAEFNKLLEEVQNKRININFSDIEAELEQRIGKLEQKKTLLPIGINNSQIDSEITALNTKLNSVKTLRIAADTTPAEQSLAETIRKVNAELAKQRELKLKAQITLPSAELSALTATKKRLEADRIRLRGTADVGSIITNLESVKARIAELNKQGVKVQVTTGELISQRSVASVKETLALVKDLKKQGGQVRVDVGIEGIENAKRSAQQVVRNFEQIIRDTPSFAISAQQGLIAISNNIGPLQDSFIQLAANAKLANTSIAGLIKSAISGWGGVVVGISIAVSLITAFAGKLFGASKEAKELDETIKGVRDTLKDASIINPLAAAGQEGDIQKIQLLTKAATDLSNSEKVRANALQSLKNFNEDVYGKYGTYASSTDGLKQSTDALVKSLVAQAIVEDKLNKIKDIAVGKTRIKEKIDEASANVKLAKSRLEAAEAVVAAPQGSANTVGGGVDISASFDITALRGDVKTAQKILDDYLVQYGRQISTSVKLKQELATEIEEALALLPFGGDPRTKGGSEADDALKRRLQSEKEVLESELKNLDNLSKRYFDIRTEIAGLDLQISNIGEVDREIKFNNFQVYQNVLKGIGVEAKNAGIELDNLKLKIAEPIFFAAPSIEPFAKIRDEAITAKKRIDDLFRSGELTIEQKVIAEAQLEFQADVEVAKLQKELDSRRLLIETGIAPQLEPVIPDQSIEALPELPDQAQMLKDMAYGVEDWNQALRNSLAPMEAAQKAAADLNKEWANLLASGLSDFFNTIFDSFAADGIVTMKELGDAVKALVVDIIKATARLLIFKAIASAFGVTDGPTGLLGAIVRPRKFATGGIITGPTFGMVGEAGAEAVLPLSYLSNLIGNGNGQSTPSLALRGSDLYWSWAQENKKNNRYG